MGLFLITTFCYDVGKIEDVSCCLKLSTTWATTPTPALWSHFFFTWNPKNTRVINYISGASILEMKIQRNAVHGCYCGQREATLLSESWHQLLSIPISVIPVSSPLLKTSSGLSNKTTQWFWQQDNSIPKCKLEYLLLILVMVITFHNFMKFYTILCMLCSFLCFHCLRRKLRSIGRNWGTVIHINNMLVSIQRLAWRLSEQIQNVSYLTQIYLPYQLPQVRCFPFSET